jgi:hypothetical protein
MNKKSSCSLACFLLSCRLAATAPTTHFGKLYPAMKRAYDPATHDRTVECSAPAISSSTNDGEGLEQSEIDANPEVSADMHKLVGGRSALSQFKLHLWRSNVTCR